MRRYLAAAALALGLLMSASVAPSSALAASCDSYRYGSYIETTCSGSGYHSSSGTYVYGNGFSDTSFSGTSVGRSFSGSGSSYNYGGTGFTDSSFSGNYTGGSSFSGSGSIYNYGNGISDTNYTVRSNGRSSSGSFSCYSYGSCGP
jgi:hypothetical protein